MTSLACSLADGVLADGVLADGVLAVGVLADGVLADAITISLRPPLPPTNIKNGKGCRKSTKLVTEQPFTSK